MNDRALAIATAIVFFVSLIFPISAGVANPSWLPSWWGILDVVIAFLLCALAILIAVRYERGVTDEIRAATYRAYRILINAFLVILVIFFLVGDRVTWTFFLPGIAWRMWLAFYAWPSWLTALRSDAISQR
jgi:hypothetical protein